MTFQDMLNAAMYGQGQGFGPAPNMPTQQPVPFSSSPPVNAMKRAFNFITNPGPSPAPDMGPFISNAQSNFGKPNAAPVKSLLPSLLAGSGASQSTPTGSAPAQPVPLPQPRPMAANGPMNITPPGASVGAGAMNPSPASGYNPGLSAVSGAAGYGQFPPQPPAPQNPFSVPFMPQNSAAATPQPQQPQGILPKLANDIGIIKKLFAGGGAPSASGSAIY